VGGRAGGVLRDAVADRTEEPAANQPIVTLPDYQGIGIGMALAETVADLNRKEGFRLNITASHPAVIAHCRHSPRWRAVGVKKTGSKNATGS